MKCPGQDTKYWKDDAIFDANCPKCGVAVEFYKDDTTRKCPGCGHRFVNPRMDFGCASYCQFAEQCLGTLPEDFMGSREDLLKDKVAVEVKRYFHTDFKRIKKATRVARYAENIGKSEGGNLSVLLCASYLQGIPGDDVLAILTKAGASEELSTEIRALLEQKKSTSADFSLAEKILNDALILAQLQETADRKSAQESVQTQAVTRELYTRSATALVEELFA